MTEDHETRVGLALQRVVELFAAVCGAPDDERVAGDADAALADLNQLLGAGTR
ncbi:hypothetical protein [Micromonospora sp. SH-82]|uniref:hypothetical protein n=1 Tax=Micromonospora sp. SH-82 TaxID=3132938 RepID=UPI003EB716CD